MKRRIRTVALYYQTKGELYYPLKCSSLSHSRRREYRKEENLSNVLEKVGKMYLKWDFNPRKVGENECIFT